jgi:hypothetical protein
MSNAQTRQDIATALSRVTGINGHPARPTVLNEGDAWPQWRGGTPHAYAIENTWAVLIVLPQADDVTADSFADAHGEALIEALRPVMFVDSLVPAEIPSEAGPMYALLLTGRSE